MGITLACYADGRVVAIIPIPKTHPLSKGGKFKKLKKTFSSRDEVTKFLKEQGLSFTGRNIKLACYADGRVVAIIPIPKAHPLSKGGQVKKLKKTFSSRDEVTKFLKEQGLV
ncbi:hypothetical protein ACL6C3_13500 [Capilliphycus salinus ALCB114379]|uniref:hypothetical protein n=1 Tax=Capilliphycus salinus TaxID=2768948 RepID=UPI0039A4D85A